MPVDLGRTLRDALSQLTAEKDKIDRQISAIESALAAMNGTIGGWRRAGSSAPAQEASTARPVRKRRPRMSAAARKAVSERMRAYWARQRAAKGAKQASGRKRAPTAKKVR